MLYTRAEQNSEINNLNSYLKKLEKEEQSKSRRKDIVRIKQKPIKLKTETQQSKSIRIRANSWQGLTKTKRKKKQNTNNKTGYFLQIIEPLKEQKCHEQLCTDKFHTLEETNQFIENANYQTNSIKMK